MATVRLSRGIGERIGAAALSGYPHESCGLLIGRQSDTMVEVLEVREAANVNQERPGDRYELDPRAMLTADRDARAQGLEVVGVWHSHPDHPAEPSETDRAGAWEGWSYIIVSIAHDAVRAMRSWRLNGERFYEENIEQ